MLSVPSIARLASHCCSSTKVFQRAVCVHLLRNITSGHLLEECEARRSVVPSSLRTHYCGRLCNEHVNQQVKIAGWLEHKRGTTFITLRDSTGNCQVLLNGHGENLPPKESIILVEGTVQLRPGENRNEKMNTGDVELCCTGLTILNECKHLPFPINDHSSSRESLRMKYRYIDLRSKVMQRNMRMRSQTVLNMRKYLCDEQEFVDIETPTLFRKTPGGAQEFLVPTQIQGKFYSLPQSPQQFKQLLMAGAIDRYMQIARCYRDEGSRPDRQPEFTQLDIEMSFTEQEEIKQLIEDMLMACWPVELNCPTSPFQRMSYYDAMNSYGCDKPDIRFNLVLRDVTSAMKDVSMFSTALAKPGGSAKCLVIPKNYLTSKQLKKVQQHIRMSENVEVSIATIRDDEFWNSALQKHVPASIQLKVNSLLDLNAGDSVIIFANEEWDICCTILGKCRALVASEAEQNGILLRDPHSYKFLWVEDFPLFTNEAGKLCSAHHPFTAPHPDDTHLLHTDPQKVRGQHYDLVLNGFEVGGGSIRIHNADLQQYVIQDILGEDSSQLTHLLEALQSGCPPHGGIALGLDRLLAIMCQANSIRDVIAFPKSNDGSDPMTGAPCEGSAEDMELYHIATNSQM